MVDLRADGSYRLDQSFFNYCAGLTMTSERFHALFGGPPRAATAELTQREFDIAASVQAVTEEIVLRLGKFAAKQTGSENLCLAGGVALNCVANSKLLKAGVFRNIWIQPAAGDAGGALGAALVAANSMNGGKRFTPPSKDAMKGALLGPSYSDNDVRQRLARIGASFEEISDETDLIRRTVDQLVHGSAVGWFQGAMEFGPRALGSRSILADPRSPRIRALLNLKVKHRESFRPFAASILRESLADWFDIDVDSPYMLLVGPVAADKRSAIPAVTHVDYSTRIQTVDAETNPLYYKLLTEFRNRTGVPLLVNTSFNVRGEPLVCTPEDAFRCFVGTELDALVAGNCFLLKSEQSPEHTMAPAATFAPD
jgi:carbamoyltransferase